ncbi:MAG: hypothetical protein JSW48_09040 [Betaproteobacteria bacterium]|jgi:hypothetical protein|nr:MAG: hypothetical protein JSW48_09040 [Betaproteobacteria bacterium]
MNQPARDDHWLTRPASIQQIWRVFYAVLALTVLAQLLTEIKGYFDIDGWFGFAGGFGFLSCAAMVLVAKALGVLLKQPDNYYDD